jgi:hypothetical protein
MGDGLNMSPPSQFRTHYEASLQPEDHEPQELPDRLITPEQLASRYSNKLSLSTLANWRAARRGPNFIKIGKQPFYRLRDIAAWEELNEVICDASIPDGRDPE